MSDEDFQSMIELASEMPWRDAARFIRSEKGVSLLEAGRLAERVADTFPDSLCARSFRGEPA